MTIVNELLNFEKYEYLKFVEFLEMICRVALNRKGYGPNTKPEDKVRDMLLTIYEKMTREKIEDFDNIEFVKLREE